MSLRDDVIGYIRQAILRNPGASLGPDDSLIEAGLLDSVGLTNVIIFVEGAAGVRIPDLEVTPENFDTATAIEALVQRLRGSA
jgi:acyl carrier protein